MSSGKVVGEKRKKSLWEKICDEFATQRAQYEDHDFDDSASSIATDVTQYSARRHTPVVYGQMVHQAHVDTDFAKDFDPAVSHPATVGLSLLSRPPPKRKPSPPPPPDPKSCGAQEYLEAFIFPTLIPAMMEMLREAKKERCFERKRTKFNACDFLTEYLYKNNPCKLPDERSEIGLWEIQFVKEHLEKNPRAPLPLSLLWSEEEATLKIQSFWRGYKVRSQPDVFEMREWQREWREENADVRKQVNDFWEEQENKDHQPKQKKSSSSHSRKDPSPAGRQSRGSGSKSKQRISGSDT